MAYFTHDAASSGIQPRPSCEPAVSGTKGDCEQHDSSSPNTHRSKSIPIASNHNRSFFETHQSEAEEAIADHRDFAMFQRIVSSMEKRQSMTRDRRLRHANHLCLRRIYRARGEDTGHAGSATCCCSCYTSAVPGQAHQEDEETMLFAFEL